MFISNSIPNPVTHHGQKLTKSNERIPRVKIPSSHLHSMYNIKIHFGKQISPPSYLTNPGPPRLPGKQGHGTASSLVSPAQGSQSGLPPPTHLGPQVSSLRYPDLSFASQLSKLPEAFWKSTLPPKKP